MSLYCQSCWKLTVVCILFIFMISLLWKGYEIIKRKNNWDCLDLSCDEIAILLCSVILLPLVITFYVTWGFVHFVDGFFSPVYDHLGINIFGKQNQPFLGSSFSFYSFVGWVLQLTRPCNYNYYETGYTAEKYSSSIAIFYLNHQKAWLNF